MKTRLIPDDHRLHRRIAVGDLLQKPTAQRQADRRQELERRPPLHHLDRALHLFPLVALRPGQHHALAPQGPAAPALRGQPKPGLIGHPDLPRAILGPIKLGEALLQFGAKRGRRGRVLLDVAGTRERAAHFSQPVRERLGRPLEAVLLLAPAGHRARPASVARAFRLCWPLVAQSTTCHRSLSRASVVERISCLRRAISCSLLLPFVRFPAMQHLAHTHFPLHSFLDRMLSGNGMTGTMNWSGR